MSKLFNAEAFDLWADTASPWLTFPALGVYLVVLAGCLVLAGGMAAVENVRGRG